MANSMALEKTNRRLIRELVEARDKIVRICKWVREEHGIIIPGYILDPYGDGRRVDTITNRKIEFVQVEGVNLKSEQLDENEDLSSTEEVHDPLDHVSSEFNDYIEEIPSKLPSKYAFLKCKPCCILLPPRIDYLPHIDAIKPQSKQANHTIVKTRPTVDERFRALYLCQNYTWFTKRPIICPITSCSHFFTNSKNTKDMFRRHLMRMHYFHEQDTKRPIRFTTDNDYDNDTVDKIVLQKKSVPKLKLKPSSGVNRVGIKSKSMDLDIKKEIQTISSTTRNQAQNQNPLQPSATTTAASANVSNNIFLIQYPVVSPTLQVQNHLQFVRLVDPVNINAPRKGPENDETRQNSIFRINRSETNQDQDFESKFSTENVIENIEIPSPSPSPLPQPPPEEIHHVNVNIDRRNVAQNWRARKKRPTKEEKSLALQLYRTSPDYLDVTCPICSISIKSKYNSRNSLKRHYIRMHYFDEKELKEYKTRVYRYNSIKVKKRPTEEQKSSALLVYRSSPDYLQVTCPICSITIRSKHNDRNSLKRHYIRMHFFDQKELKEPYKSRISLKGKLSQDQKLQVLQSIQDYSNNDNNDNDIGKSLACPACPKRRFIQTSKHSMSLKARFKSHLRVVHMFSQHDFFMCNLVQDHTTSISISGERSKRRSRDYKNGRYKFLCPICGQYYRHSHMLKKHHVKCHSNLEPTFQCDICTTTRLFHFKSDLMVHKKCHLNAISTERNFICQVCGSAFKRMYDLRGHMDVHSEVKKYKCTYENCDKAYKQAQPLITHIKRFHTEGGQVKKHHCEKCGLSFLKRYDLKKHRQAVHEHVRPFECTICSKAFKTKASLKYHTNTHSNPNSKNRGYNKPKDF